MRSNAKVEWKTLSLTLRWHVRPRMWHTRPLPFEAYQKLLQSFATMANKLHVGVYIYDSHLESRLLVRIHPTLTWDTFQQKHGCGILIIRSQSLTKSAMQQQSIIILQNHVVPAIGPCFGIGSYFAHVCGCRHVTTTTTWSTQNFCRKCAGTATQECRQN